MKPVKQTNRAFTKAERLVQLQKAVESGNIDFSSSEDIKPWLNIFVDTNDNDENYNYLTQAIDLLGKNNPYVFAYFEYIMQHGGSELKPLVPIVYHQLMKVKTENYHLSIINSGIDMINKQFANDDEFIVNFNI